MCTIRPDHYYYILIYVRFPTQSWFLSLSLYLDCQLIPESFAEFWCVGFWQVKVKCLIIFNMICLDKINNFDTQIMQSESRSKNVSYQWVCLFCFIKTHRVATEPGLFLRTFLRPGWRYKAVKDYSNHYIAITCALFNHSDATSKMLRHLSTFLLRNNINRNHVLA